ncbi:hypothetical protein BD310DRAFT_912769 [Dichomitus squalens]|uniref:Uncharacterized protein n=1 Tax=Dichomitus squalens TaxID=114155 RepID=A0A4Q9QEC2_9APHY|nr:hypothetical protein BD310DRAFT_912769 [Dichomitus squalens]
MVLSGPSELLFVSSMATDNERSSERSAGRTAVKAAERAKPNVHSLELRPPGKAYACRNMSMFNQRTFGSVAKAAYSLSGASRRLLVMFVAAKAGEAGSGCEKNLPKRDWSQRETAWMFCCCANHAEWQVSTILGPTVVSGEVTHLQLDRSGS